MAEYCKECFYKYNPECAGIPLEMSREKDLCEGCGEWKRVVIGYRTGLFADLIGAFISDIEEPTKEDKERDWKAILKKIREKKRQ